MLSAWFAEVFFNRFALDGEVGKEGFRVEGFRVWGLGFRAKGLGFRCLGFRGLGFRGLGFRGSRVQSLGVYGVGSECSDIWLRSQDRYLSQHSILREVFCACLSCFEVTHFLPCCRSSRNRRPRVCHDAKSSCAL